MKHRSHELEWMDDLEMEGQQLLDTLKTLAKINARLGGDAVSLKGVCKLSREADSATGLHIIDLGCGEGSQLRHLANYSRKHQLDWRFTGVDANATCIAFAEQRSQNYPEITYLKGDVFKWDMPECDIVLATLFMHHFDDQQIKQMIESAKSKTRLGWVVNDLQRSPIAYGLFWSLGLFIRNEMIMHDGLLSIKKGFKKHELKQMSNTLKMQSEVNWNWAFRYLWLLRS
ncbi:methyltransferase domain-containing protein [Gilvibacter sp.]|uniref:methyltransferase domain-containing protein n=1 Tax=Gilvibacter sp. TaxID=2729997 RepID=UPI003F4A350E